jgi:DNA-binding MarR family transcriptional regulator
MRTSAQTTSIDAYHSHRGQSAQQRRRVLEFIKQCGGDWSIGELAHALGLEKSTVSARVNEALYETHELVEAPRRKDKRSGITVRPVKLPPRGQGELFQ